MKAKVIKDFTASANGRQYDCSAGDEVEADVKTVEQMEAIGLVKTKQSETGAKEPGKGDGDD